MEIINLILFLWSLYLSRKNLFIFVFLIFLFIFCYSRYLIAIIDGSYILGGAEWVFPGVSGNTIDIYSLLFLIVQLVFISCSPLIRPIKTSAFSLDREYYFKVITYIVLLLLTYKTYLIFNVIVSSGYLASVDMSFPLWLSISTSSFVKPILLSLVLLSIGKFKTKEMKIFYFFIIILALSSQRKDLISVLLFLMVYSLTFKSNKYIKLMLGLISVTILSLFIFIIREGDSFEFNNKIITDIIWSNGFSVNSGLFVIDRGSSFEQMDSLGFFNTYFYCGFGRFFSDLCYSPERLHSIGFLLEKISSFMSFKTETIFGGIGGNLIGSLYVASGFNDYPFLVALFIFIMFCYFVFFMIIFISSYRILNVTMALFLCQILVASRYSFDGFIPPFNQLLVAILFDILFLKKRVDKK